MQRHANKDQYMQTAPNKLSIPSNNYLATIKEVVLDVLEKEAVRTQITNSLRPEKTSIMNLSSIWSPLSRDR